MTPREWTDRLCQILDDMSLPLEDRDREAIHEVIEAAMADERTASLHVAYAAFTKPWDGLRSDFERGMDALLAIEARGGK